MAKQGKGSRRKGNKFENDVAKIIGKWWYNDETALVRTPLSGGHHWAGDIIPKNDDPDFPFCIECKNQEGWSFEQLFTAPESQIYQWWKQTVDECPEGKDPILIFTRNRLPIFIAVEEIIFFYRYIDKDLDIFIDTKHFTITQLSELTGDTDG